MILKCTFSEEAEEDLREALGFYALDDLEGLELEFREVPYFIVSRSKASWQPEQGDINVIRILSATDRGLIVDPDSRPLPGDPGQAHRHTLIPWTNVLSMTVGRRSAAAE
jgi:hypothetical protein